MANSVSVSSIDVNVAESHLGSWNAMVRRWVATAVRTRQPSVLTSNPSRAAPPVAIKPLIGVMPRDDKVTHAPSLPVCWPRSMDTEVAMDRTILKICVAMHKASFECSNSMACVGAAEDKSSDVLSALLTIVSSARCGAAAMLSIEPPHPFRPAKYTIEYHDSVVYLSGCPKDASEKIWREEFKRHYATPFADICLDRIVAMAKLGPMMVFAGTMLKMAGLAQNMASAYLRNLNVELFRIMGPESAAILALPWFVAAACIEVSSAFADSTGLAMVMDAAVSESVNRCLDLSPDEFAASLRREATIRSSAPRAGRRTTAVAMMPVQEMAIYQEAATPRPSTPGAHAPATNALMLFSAPTPAPGMMALPFVPDAQAGPAITWNAPPIAPEHEHELTTALASVRENLANSINNNGFLSPAPAGSKTPTWN